MIKCNKKLVIFGLAAFITSASLGIGTAYASTALSLATDKINHLESSFEKNYLGSKNLPTFRTYLSEAKILTSKVTSVYDRNKLEDRIKQCEVVIVTTEHVVNMETSMEKNYKGVRNLPTFQAYLDKLNASLINVKNSIIHKKLSERSYAGFNVIRDIKIVDSENYSKALVLRDEAIALFNEENLEGAKAKAIEALEFVWKCETSLAKDAIASELKTIRDM